MRHLPLKRKPFFLCCALKGQAAEENNKNAQAAACAFLRDSRENR